MAGLVYSYLRFSDPKQAAGTSSERQAAYAARWAAEHGLQLDETLSLRDEGLSAYHQTHVRRGALGAFLAAMDAGKVPDGSVLVVEALDRLSRAEVLDAQAQLISIVNAGISVVTASDNKVYSRERLRENSMDLIYSLLVMQRAYEESATKAKRVKAAILNRCQGWLAGTYRGLIRNGKDPVWVHLVEGQWQLIPERVEAVRYGLELYRRGYSARKAVQALAARGMSLTGRGPQSLQIYRLIHQRALLGEKELEVEGEQFCLPGYYPALLTLDEWQDLRALATGRGRRQAHGPVPHVVTGMRITVCGYCGASMVGQNIGTRRRDEAGRIQDGHRRLHCTSYHRNGCAVSGSTSVAPVERAIMSYCSDIINLRALYGGDRSASLRATLATARAALEKVTAMLENLTDAMLQAAGDGGTPLTFVKRARALETEQAELQAKVDAAERELAAAARSDLSGADSVWRSLAAGVEAQDHDARLQARQLVADTFERIVVWHRGITPDESPPGVLDLLLQAKGGTARLLRVDKKGRWVQADDWTEPEGEPAQA